MIVLQRGRRERGIYRTLEIVKSRGQDFDAGEHTLRISAGQGPIVWSPALCAELLDPTRWHDVLEGYARSTQLAVALVDPTGHLLGRCHNPQPVWSLVRAAQPAGRVSVLPVPRAALHRGRYACARGSPCWRGIGRG